MRRLKNVAILVYSLQGLPVQRLITNLGEGRRWVHSPHFYNIHKICSEAFKIKTFRAVCIRCNCGRAHRLDVAKMNLVNKLLYRNWIHGEMTVM